MDAGQSSPSSALTVTTDEEIPQGAPLNLMASSVTSRDFLISWSPPSVELRNGVINSFYISVRESVDEAGKTLNRTMVPSSSTGHVMEYRVTQVNICLTLIYRNHLSWGSFQRLEKALSRLFIEFSF